MSFDDTVLGKSATQHGRADVMEFSVIAGAAAPAAARHAIRRWLGARTNDRVLIDAPLVVSELVTNSVRHAGLPVSATVHISAQLVDGVLRLEVADPGTAGAVARRAAGGDRAGGFGLNIVDMLASRWGIQRDDGTLVWAELGC
jgi:anti-sigma regulatory factor (Ser/Thr protein kinase)